MQRSLPKHAQKGKHQGARMTMEAKVVSRLVYFLASVSIHISHTSALRSTACTLSLFPISSILFALAAVSTGSLSLCPSPEMADKPTRHQKLRQSLTFDGWRTSGAHLARTNPCSVNLWISITVMNKLPGCLSVARNLVWLPALTGASELPPLIGNARFSSVCARASFTPLASFDLGSQTHCSPSCYGLDLLAGCCVLLHEVAQITHGSCLKGSCRKMGLLRQTCLSGVLLRVSRGRVGISDSVLVCIASNGDSVINRCQSGKERAVTDQLSHEDCPHLSICRLINPEDQ
jgi:hypothetical protein